MSLATYREWQNLCSQKREFALTHPLRHEKLIVLPEFHFTQRSFHLPYVEWHIRFGLHGWAQPKYWEASITLVTDYPDTENKFGEPDKGTPFFINWEPEQKKEARLMLNDVFGDIIRYADDNQRVFVFEGSTHLLLRVIFEPQYFLAAA